MTRRDVRATTGPWTWTVRVLQVLVVAAEICAWVISGFWGFGVAALFFALAFITTIFPRGRRP